MMINFTERPKFSDNFPNWWRNFFAVVVLVLTIVTGTLYYRFDNQTKFYLAQFTSEQKVDGSIELSYENSGIGGDIYFEDNNIVTPHLSASSTPLSPDNFTASNILVKDRDSGLVLYGKNSYEKHAMASITKLMSALVLLEQRLDWNATTTVSADKVSGSNIYAGDTYTISELWDIAFVASSNKAILTLVDSSGMSRESFVIRMNEKAREIGLLDTTFVEPTGLDAGNVSTASDIVILLNEALSKEKIKDALSLLEVNLFSKERDKQVHAWNTDWLLLNWVPNDYDVLGGKTGYIDNSLYNFTVSLKNKEGHILDVVVLGAREHKLRFTEAKEIADWVFANYIWE
ncbi:MAG: hypothetical protein COX80_00020 [Candidatus Magasanikbacteria bacterium CG_4_10_14_0_2_um_filter_33_14]|uniref:Peptidase S11 D-alanyl-D-alanine carboxypeptidase A N-terminal domain-containing protein n=1 Tax=Candidatus Magasanikbacteria bacterium CG_4_10_14_0_2_um_filter_33_14 TaxID=1974636 RepID=A0A2M7VC59_9BACT|nr:MAG: hypothetical protein COX80_00020 [Candidatus Magasanikbacteria bacterium CG_4_10_14_0_2_um_filter_33_14]